MIILCRETVLFATVIVIVVEKLFCELRSDKNISVRRMVKLSCDVGVYLAQTTGSVFIFGCQVNSLFVHS
jgi:hypothetical protein